MSSFHTIRVEPRKDGSVAVTGPKDIQPGDFVQWASESGTVIVRFQTPFSEVEIRSGDIRRVLFDVSGKYFIALVLPDGTVCTNATRPGAGTSGTEGNGGTCWPNQAAGCQGGPKV